MSKTPPFTELNGAFITKLFDIANYFNSYFINKVKSDVRIRNQMLPVSSKLSDSILRKKIMYDKEWSFEFKLTNAADIEKLLLALKSDKPCAVDNLDSRLLQLSAKTVARPLSHIFNLCFDNCFSSAVTAKVIPLPKTPKESFIGRDSRPISYYLS